MTLEEEIHSLGRRAKAASRILSQAKTEQKNIALLAMADAVLAQSDAILAANQLDLDAATANGLSGAMLDRLRLNPERLSKMAEGICSVAALSDPNGALISDWTRPNGIHISKVRVPIGTIGIIYESRPNVTSDAAILCLKTGNATLLRGGSEAIRSNGAIAAALQAGLYTAGLPVDSILLVPKTDRDGVRIMAQMNQYLDIIIPRGGKGLIEAVVQNARMPVIKHYDGICHVYVDANVNYIMASEIIINGKCQRPGVCNAVETVLVHRAIAADFIPIVARQLAKNGVEIRADEPSFSQLQTLEYPKLKQATEQDFRTEHLDLIVNLRIVENLDRAIDHIETNGSHHSDTIVSNNNIAAERFLNEIDSATVFWNASTRFNDGGEFGFGAEIGISTDKLHARGPMGLEELTTYKYQIRGTGQVRS
ncbi:MAG TPA: glutamate-5-semialdehyde dehydrogenase [Chthoniobacterales bacterium]|jgi:glutamate-5-semialdehyde dehydrogenase